MRVRTKEDVEKLEKKIKDELGINVEKYRNEDVVENFVELLVFPKYVITWLIMPIITSILFYIVGFFLFDMVHIEYLLYGLIGLFLFLLIGIIFGLLFLMQKMKSDMFGIMDYSLNVMESAVKDMYQVNNQITIENRRDVLGLLFKGIIHIVTVPTISKIISDKLPLVGVILKRIVKRVLTVVADRVKFDEQKLKKELKKAEGETNALQIYSKSISTVSSGLEKLMDFTFGVVRFPLKMSFGILFITLLLFIYMIN